MSVSRIISAIILGTLATASAIGQTAADFIEQSGRDMSRPEARARVVEQVRNLQQTQKDEAVRVAKLRGLPGRVQRDNGKIEEIVAIGPDGQPVYLATSNANAAISTGANLLRVAPYNLSGTGFTVGIWDGGSARTTHQELTGRVTVKDGAAAIDHATHVAGTIAATGVDVAAKGMAPSATVDSYDWNTDTAEMTARGATTAYEAGRILLSNHSYNYVGGWNYVNDGTRVWEWWGSGSTTASIETDFGMYNTYTRDQDALAFSAPYYTIFRSAGNDRGDNPANGQLVSLSPGATPVAYSSASHPAGDGAYRGGYDTIGFAALSKNVITMGSVADAVAGALRSPAAANVSSFSTFGPTDDGRIKPDLVANGEAVKSPVNTSNTAYAYYNGTSMATPNATGTAALLLQMHANLFPGVGMRSSTLKGLLIHTADDRGNVGPDYQYGWGLIDAKEAADLLQDQHDYPAKQRVTEAIIQSTDTIVTRDFIWDGVSPIRATLCWLDPAGTAATSSDSRTARLVNNLNMKIVGPTGVEYFPWVMPFVGTWTQASMSLPATTGTNNTDNIEQILIAAPPQAGVYSLRISYSGTLANSQQAYSLLVSGASVEPPPPPPPVLTGISPNSALPGIVNATVSGSGLTASTVVKLAKSGQTDITGTITSVAGGSLACQFNTTNATGGAWDVVATNPDNSSSTLAGGFTVIVPLWSETFDGVVNGWTSTAEIGTNSWSKVSTQVHTTPFSYFAPAPAAESLTHLVSPSFLVPANATNLQFSFRHWYNLESGKDYGRLQFRVANAPGSGTWTDIGFSGTAFASNGYNDSITIRNKGDSIVVPMWSGNANGFVQTIVNLTGTGFAGKYLQWRWSLTSNSRNASTGWWVDTMVLTGGGSVVQQAPVISSVHTASTELIVDPPLDGLTYEIIRGAETMLTAVATDDGGGAALIYTWACDKPVAFAQNASNAASQTTVSFTVPGDHVFTVTVRDAAGLEATGSVRARVLQTASGLEVVPGVASVVYGGQVDFNARTFDQFGETMAGQAVAWGASGGGSIDANGLFTATAAGGPYTINASSAGFGASAGVTVTKAPATVTITGLEHTADGTEKHVSVVTSPSGLAHTVTYNGSSTKPSIAGSYEVIATITAPNYEGAATETMVIAPGGIDGWKADEFTAEERAAGTADDNADPDSDGFSNLIEYALGQAPKLADAPLDFNVTSTGAELLFTRKNGITDALCSVRSSPDLLDWSTTVPLEETADGDVVHVRAAVPFTPVKPPRLFLRLGVTRH